MTKKINVAELPEFDSVGKLRKPLGTRAARPHLLEKCLPVGRQAGIMPALPAKNEVFGDCLYWK